MAMPIECAIESRSPSKAQAKRAIADGAVAATSRALIAGA